MHSSKIIFEAPNWGMLFFNFLLIDDLLIDLFLPGQIFLKFLLVFHISFLLMQIIKKLFLLLGLFFHFYLLSWFKARQFCDFSLQSLFYFFDFKVILNFKIFFEFLLLLLELDPVFPLDINLLLFNDGHWFFPHLMFKVFLENVLKLLTFFLEF